MFALLIASPAFPQDDCGLRLTTYSTYTVWRSPDLLIFTSGMTIDADGSPRAYHPDNVSGLDDLSNAGSPAHWVALLTRDGEPVTQGPGDPAPGYYISMTSLEDRRYPATSPAHFVDSEQVPYIALPPDLGPELGDVAYVVNTANSKSSPAIFADQSPAGRLGEGSIALARNLGINPDARNGGVRQGVLYVVFLHSSRHSPIPKEDLSARTAELRDARAEIAVQCVADVISDDPRAYGGVE